MKAKIITIEGTDCSGKETQSKILESTLKMDGYSVRRYSFPQYEEPTGRIVGGPYLGKPEIMPCFFKEGATSVDPIVASLYYAADRRYAFLKFIERESENADALILDRYTTSNMGHQGSKIADTLAQDDFFEKIARLEYEICELPQSDLTLFLHMPVEGARLLKRNRKDLDEHEKSEEHLRRAEETYLRLYKKYGWVYISCLREEFKDFDSIKTPDVIAREIYSEVEKVLGTPTSPHLALTRY